MPCLLLCREQRLHDLREIFKAVPYVAAPPLGRRGLFVPKLRVSATWRGTTNGSPPAQGLALHRIFYAHVCKAVELSS